MNEDDDKPVDGMMEWWFPGFPKISDQAFLLIHMSTSKPGETKPDYLLGVAPNIVIAALIDIGTHPPWKN